MEIYKYGELWEGFLKKVDFVMNLKDGQNSRFREQIEQKNTLEVYLMFIYHIPNVPCDSLRNIFTSVN